MRAPASPHLISEVRLVAEIAKATLDPNPKVPWDAWADDYSRIRAAIAETYPEIFHDYDRRMWEPGGFHRRSAGARAGVEDQDRQGQLRHAARPGRGSATCRRSAHDVLRLITLRSNDQFNTTVYGYNDRFRGIKGTRMVVLMNRGDIDRLGLAGRRDGDAADGRRRTTSCAPMSGLRVVAVQHPGRLHRRLLPGGERAAADLALCRRQQDAGGEVHSGAGGAAGDAMTDHYDIIVIGSGPGGASAAQRLAPTGKRILMLERGDYLPRSQQNWDAKAVFVDGIYQTKKLVRRGWPDLPSRPALFVGGNSKVYGAALFRLRERDWKMAEHSIDFWLQSEDLPNPANRVYYDGDRVVLDLQPTGGEAAAACAPRWKGCWTRWALARLIERRLYLGKNIPIGGTAHQAGCRFGTDPASSVLDLDCKAHELDNCISRTPASFPRSAR